MVFVASVIHGVKSARTMGLVHKFVLSVMVISISINAKINAQTTRMQTKRIAHVWNATQNAVGVRVRVTKIA